MFLVVGLGNPGRKYEHTRHNVGFDVVDILSQKYEIPLRKSRCKAITGEGVIAGQKVALALPQTYMNLSGESVVQLVNWYKPEMDQLLVCYDDIDLPDGKVRFRPSGSAGTHNGMRNIIYLLGRDDFPRMRVGTGRPPEHMDLKDYVLMGYETKELRETMFQGYLLAAEACVGAVALFVAEVLPGQLIAIFGAKNESVYYTEFAVKAFRVYLCMLPLACVNKAVFIFLQAMGKAVASTLLSMAREIVFGVGFAVLLPVFFGLDGVLYSMPVSDVLTALLSALLIVMTYKQLPQKE